MLTRSMHAYDASCCSKHHALIGRAAQVAGVTRLVGVQRAAQNNGNVKNECKLSGLWRISSTCFLLLIFFLFSSCSLSFYDGLTSWFYSLSESLAVSCVQQSLLHLTPPNTYVAKAQLHYPLRLLLPKTSSRRCVMHVVSDILLGVTSNLYSIPKRYRKLTFLSVTRHVRTCIARIDPSFKASC